MNESSLSDAELAEMLSLTVEVTKWGTIYRNHLGQKHRVHGPAVILSPGSTMWFRNGARHRTDGPAVITLSGTRHWYQITNCTEQMALLLKQTGTNAGS